MLNIPERAEALYGDMAMLEGVFDLLREACGEDRVASAGALACRRYRELVEEARDLAGEARKQLAPDRAPNSRP